MSVTVKRVKSLLRAARKSRVLVVGDVMLLMIYKIRVCFWNATLEDSENLLALLLVGTKRTQHGGLESMELILKLRKMVEFFRYLILHKL